MTLGRNTFIPDNKRRREPKERVFALQIVVVQLLFTVLLSLLGWLVSQQNMSQQTAFAILCGGIISSLANLWFAVVAFRPALGKTPQQMLAAFYIGEIGKFVITAILFLIVFKKIALFKEPRNALFMFAAFLMVHFTVWIYPLVRSLFFASLAKINRR